MRKKERKSALRCALAIFGFLVFVRLPVFAFNAHQPFDISADVLDFVDETQEVTARGHVVIVQSSSTLNADVVRYDRLHRRLIARGNVILRESEGVMIGDQLDYDLEKEKGVVLGGKGYSSSWFFQGGSWDKNKDYYIARNASFTSCDLIDPHYHIKSSRVHLIPDQLFWSWNNVFYVDNLPVMYTPFMYKYLQDRPITFQAQPGTDSLLGSFAKTTTTMRFTPHVYDKLYLDYYSVAGQGYGNEFDFEVPGHNKGSFFGYYIDPHPEAVLSGAPEGPQYNIRGYLWQKVSPTTQLQINSNLRQNISFNTQYFSQDPNQSQNDVLSSLALTQQTTTYNQHLVVQREDAPDPPDTSAFATTHLQNASLPSYDFTLFQRPLWSPKNKNVVLALPTGSTAYSLGPYLPSETTAYLSAMGPFLTPGTTNVLLIPPPTLVPGPPQKIGPILFNLTGLAQNQFERIDNRVHSNAQRSSMSVKIFHSRVIGPMIRVFLPKSIGRTKDRPPASARIPKKGIRAEPRLETACVGGRCPR